MVSTKCFLRSYFCKFKLQTLCLLEWVEVEVSIHHFQPSSCLLAPRLTGIKCVLPWSRPCSLGSTWSLTLSFLRYQFSISSCWSSLELHVSIGAPEPFSQTLYFYIFLSLSIQLCIFSEKKENNKTRQRN
jgi:hypothetical protein